MLKISTTEIRALMFFYHFRWFLTNFSGFIINFCAFNLLESARLASFLSLHFSMLISTFSENYSKTNRFTKEFYSITPLFF